MPWVFPTREMGENPPPTWQKLAHLPRLEKFLFSMLTAAKIPSPMVKITPPQVLATKWWRGGSFHPLTLFGKPWYYCVGMNWYTAPSISRWLPLYLLHQVLLPSLTLSLLEKLKNSIFEMPTIPQTLKINNSRTTRPKSINLHTIRNLIEYSLKKVPIKAMFSPTVFEILMSEGRSVLWLTQQSTGSERAVMLIGNLD